MFLYPEIIAGSVATGNSAEREKKLKVTYRIQDREHQIADADTGKPIKTKTSLVSGVIEEKTGMDFDSFLPLLQNASPHVPGSLVQLPPCSMQQCSSVKLGLKLSYPQLQ